MHKCKFCEKEFNSGPELGSHVRFHTKKLIECPLCSSKVGLRALESHQKKCIERANRKNFCETCQKETKHYKNRFCSTACANKARLHTEETKLKIGKALKAKTLLELTKIKIGNSLREYSSTDEQKNKKIEIFLEKRKPRFCKYCNKETFSIDEKPTKDICTPLCLESKLKKYENLSKALKGKSGGYRIRGGRGKGSHYKGVWMDSTWEVEFVQRLDFLEIKWERDTGRHRLSYLDKIGNKRNYFPDFYLPDYDIYVEIKGYWTPDVKHKMLSVQQQNINLRLIILDKLEEIKNFNQETIKEKCKLNLIV